MEKVKTSGIYFNACDIRAIIDQHLSWAEIVEDQVYCAKNVMSDATPIGTSIIVGVDGITCKAGSDTLKLVLSSGIYELDVKTTHTNDEMNIRFDKTVPVPGTYGVMVDNVLDILTDEEKAFKKFVEEKLADREDEYAVAFRRDNVRHIGGRGLILLEKIKAEIEANDVLIDSAITPDQLIAVFIEMTEKYITSCAAVEEMMAKHDDLLNRYRETFVEDSKPTKKLARDIEVINRKIDSNRQIGSFCMAVITAAVNPVLESEVE